MDTPYLAHEEDKYTHMHIALNFAVNTTIAS